MSAEASQKGVLTRFIHGVRTLLIVQLLVAALAVGATVWAMLKLPQLRAEHASLVQQNDRLRAENEKQTDDARRLAERIQGTTDAFPFLSQGLEASAKPNWEDAVRFLAQANNLAQGNAGILRALSWAEFNAGAYEDAISHLSAAQTLSGDDALPQDFTRLATYQCAAGHTDQALATLGSQKFAPAARANPALIENDARLIQRCRAVRLQILSLARAPSATQDTGAFKVRFVFLHVSRPEDRANAEALGQRLQSAPGDAYTVPAVEVVERFNLPGIRYYYGPQGEEAGRIAALIQQSAADLHLDAWSQGPLRTVSLEGRYHGLPTNSVEVWLPTSGAPPAPTYVR